METCCGHSACCCCAAAAAAADDDDDDDDDVSSACFCSFSSDSCQREADSKYTCAWDLRNGVQAASCFPKMLVETYPPLRHRSWHVSMRRQLLRAVPSCC